MTIKKEYEQMLESTTDLSDQLELIYRLGVIKSAELIFLNIPTNNKDVNHHYRQLDHFLESLMFSTASELIERESSRQPIHTSYIDLVNSIVGLRQQFKDDVKNKKIDSHASYRIAVDKAINEGLTKWMNFRNVVRNPYREER